MTTPGTPTSLGHVIDAVWAWLEANPERAELLYHHLPGSTAPGPDAPGGVRVAPRPPRLRLHRAAAGPAAAGPPSPTMPTETLAVRTLISLTVLVHPMRSQDGPLARDSGRAVRRALERRVGPDRDLRADWEERRADRPRDARRLAARPGHRPAGQRRPSASGSSSSSACWPRSSASTPSTSASTTSASTRCRRRRPVLAAVAERTSSRAAVDRGQPARPPRPGAASPRTTPPSTCCPAAESS